MYPTKGTDSSEVDRLQSVVDKLRAELGACHIFPYSLQAPHHYAEQAQKQAAASAAQTQELFDRFAEEQRLASSHVAEMSVDLITAPARDEEQQRLDLRFKELEEERRQFTEAAIRLGREKAALEVGTFFVPNSLVLILFVPQAERLKLLEEKRSWEVDMMLAELPPTPAPAAGSSYQPPSIPAAMLPKASPRRSPRKLKKGVNGRKTRVSRRSSVLSASAISPRKDKVLPAYETEVIPIIPPSPSRQLPEFKTSLEALCPPSPVHLTNSFVLPPPSPAASLPSRVGSATTLPPIPPLPKLEIPPPFEDTSEDDIMDTSPGPVPPLSSASSSSTSLDAPVLSGPGMPSTPVVRPFPMAKPFAQRMIHAYSPVKPSPLSRILMMADSPESPGSPKLDALAEVDENAMDTTPVHSQEPIRSLAEELGVSEDDSPLREKDLAPKARPQSAAATRRAGGGVHTSDRRAAVEKGQGKGKAPAPSGITAAPTTTSRARAGGMLEKENVKRVKLSDPAGSGGKTGGSTSSASSSGSNSGKKTSSGKPAGIGARAKTQTGSGGRAAASKPKLTLKGGPRRVPAGSAEAATVPTWRG